MTPTPVRETARLLPSNGPAVLATEPLLRELEALRRSEASLRDFIETATVGMHSVSADGTILWANQAELDLLGYRQDELLSMTPAELILPEDLLINPPRLEAVLTGETLRHERRLRCRDGTVIHAEVSAKRLPVCLSADIAEPVYRTLIEQSIRHELEAFDKK